jgi:hypothetical protein
MMRPRVLALLLLVPLLAACGGADHGEKSASSSPVPGRSGLLFVQPATSGQLTPNEDGTMTLHLEGVDSTIWFTDRPERKTGTEATGDFVDAWAAGDDSFAAQPPNAVVQAQQNGIRRDLPIELAGRPHFAPAGGVIDYVVRTLPKLPASGQLKTKDAVPPLQPGALGAATMFIDDAAQPTCWVMWSMTNVNNGINAGITDVTGGTINYTFDGEVSLLSNNLFGFIPQSGPFGTAGPDAWHATPTQSYFVGNGLVGGQLYFFTWFQAAQGSSAVTGSFLGAGAQPTAAQASCNVNIGNATPYPFTITFS